MKLVRLGFQLLLGLAAASVLGQQFQNPSFETPNVGQNQWVAGNSTGAIWSFSSQAGLANGNSSWGYNAHSGQQYAFIHSSSLTNGSVSQTVNNFQVGHTYVISFWLARRGANVGATGVMPVEVVMNGTTQIFPFGGPPGDYNWYQFSTQPFTVTQTTNSFDWIGVDNGTDRGTILDDVTIQDVTKHPWPMDRADRYGTGKAAAGPDPSQLTTPWNFAVLSPGITVSHAPAIDVFGVGYYGEWNTGSFIKFDTTTGNVLGSTNLGATIQSTPFVGIDNGVTVHAAPNLFCLNTPPLTQRWAFNTATTFQNNFEAASPVAGPDGDVVFPSTLGVVTRLNHTTGAVVWQQATLPTAHSVAFSRDDSMVFVSNGSMMTALRYSDGGIVWSNDFGSATGVPAVAANGFVVFGTSLGLVFAVDPAAGGTNWVVPANGPVMGSPAFDGQHVYADSLDGSVYAFDLATGNSVWTFPTPSPLDIAPIVGKDGSVYCFNRTGDLYRLSSDGNMVWHVVIPGGARGSISMGSDATLYVPNGGGTGLYILRQLAIPTVDFDSAQSDRGTTVSGSFASTHASDNVYWILKNGIVLNPTEDPIRVIFQGTMPYSDISSFSIRLEASTSTVGLAQTVYAQNVSTGLWEVIDSRAVSTTDSSILVDVTSNANRFIDPVTRKIKIRVGYKPSGPVGSSSWLGKIDLARLERIVPTFHP